MAKHMILTYLHFRILKFPLRNQLLIGFPLVNPPKTWPGPHRGRPRRGCCESKPRGLMLGNIQKSWIPSGKHTKSYWKWPSRNSVFIIYLSINSMVIFHSYVNVYQRVWSFMWVRINMMKTNMKTYHWFIHVCNMLKTIPSGNLT